MLTIKLCDNKKKHFHIERGQFPQQICILPIRFFSLQIIPSKHFEHVARFACPTANDVSVNMCKIVHSLLANRIEEPVKHNFQNAELGPETSVAGYEIYQRNYKFNVSAFRTVRICISNKLWQIIDTKPDYLKERRKKNAKRLVNDRPLAYFKLLPR